MIIYDKCNLTLTLSSRINSNITNEGVLDVMKLVLNHIIYNHNNNFSSKSDFYL